MDKHLITAIIGIVIVVGIVGFTLIQGSSRNSNNTQPVKTVQQEQSDKTVATETNLSVEDASDSVKSDTVVKTIAIEAGTNKSFVYYWYALYASVFINLLIFRFGRPVYLFWKHKFSVKKVIQETRDTVSIYIAGENIEDFPIQPGQFMILRFLTKDFWWQAHPFSLSNIPDKILRITIKNVGDFTAKIPTIKKKCFSYY